mgnify:CR=1 FL=1
MSPTLMAVIMLVVVIACILWNKIPMNFVMFVVPLVCMFGLGYNLGEVSGFIINQVNTVMASAGYMLLFGLVYFSMLTETGMFEIIINKMLSLLGNKMNVIVIFVMTSLISCVAYLTASMSTSYLIVFPIMIPLFRKFKIDRNYAFLICQTAISAMCWLPWGIGVVNSAMMAGVSPEELASASIPWGLCFIPAMILQWVYFAICHKKKEGTLGLPAVAAEVVETEKKEANPNARPQFFWVNLLVFVAVVVCLAYFKLPSYLVFIAACMVTAMINYPKDFGKIWNKAGLTFFNVLIMLIAICFYLAVFNMSKMDPETQEILRPSMVSALAETLTTVFPAFLMKYMFLIFLLLVVPIIHFVPYQLYNTMYPLFISVGAIFGMGSMAIIAPFVCNLGLATSVTPMNSATYVGCTLCDIEVDHFTNWGGVVMFFTNLLVVITALVTGVMRF